MGLRAFMATANSMAVPELQDQNSKHEVGMTGAKKDAPTSALKCEGVTVRPVDVMTGPVVGRLVDEVKYSVKEMRRKPVPGSKSEG
jgi:hypothetical protein